jgi:uncharacterized membrane protein SpoIIM required for sporulation
MNEYLGASAIVIMALGITAAAASLLLQWQLTEVAASITTTLAPVLLVPIAISDDNIYLAWPTNKTGNYEVMFRASTDGGATFTDKINLSNSTDAESQDVQIAANNDNVIVTWWERNATSNEPVVTISTDNGTTFAPVMKLATNGTISMAE